MSGHILVTGGAGFIGSHTCVELLSAGYRVTIVDNLSNSNVHVVDRINTITGKSNDLTFKNVDLCDKTALQQVFKDSLFDGVIHFAACKAVPESKVKPLMYYQNNLISVLNLLGCMEEAGCKTLIFSSSCTVYGVQESPLDETKPTNPGTNAYAGSKYWSENMLFELCSCDPTWSVCILRYFNPVAAHSSGLIGEDPRGVPAGLMSYALQVMVGRQEKLTIFGSDYPTRDGTCIRDFIHVSDVADAHLAALRWLAQEAAIREGAGKPRGVIDVFNLGTGNGQTVKELVDALGKAAGKQVPHVLGPRRPADLMAAYANPEKASRVLGWTAKYGLDKMCEDAWRWQSNNPSGYDS